MGLCPTSVIPSLEALDTVCRHSVVGEEPSDDLLQPAPLIGDRLMHPPSQLFLKCRPPQMSDQGLRGALVRRGAEQAQERSTFPGVFALNTRVHARIRAKTLAACLLLPTAAQKR